MIHPTGGGKINEHKEYALLAQHGNQYNVGISKFPPTIIKAMWISPWMVNEQEARAKYDELK